MKRILTVVLAAFCLAGCLDDTPVSTFDGTYVLRTVNGAPLPYTISDAGGKRVELLDDRYTIFQGETYSAAGHVRTTTNGQASVTERADAGSFTFEFQNLKLRSALGAPDRIANLDGRSFTIVDIGVSYFYSR